MFDKYINAPRIDISVNRIDFSDCKQFSAAKAFPVMRSSVSFCNPHSMRQPSTKCIVFQWPKGWFCWDWRPAGSQYTRNDAISSANIWATEKTASEKWVGRNALHFLKYLLFIVRLIARSAWDYQSTQMECEQLSIENFNIRKKMETAHVTVYQFVESFGQYTRCRNVFTYSACISEN